MKIKQVIHMVSRPSYRQNGQLQLIPARSIAAAIKKVFLLYEAKGRHDLPWRKDISPYSILISEIMLQQTQVHRVLPKYVAWMKKYPTLAHVQKASLKELLILWEGLGYQRRVKGIFSISHLVKAIPSTYEELLKLPSIGPYTATAILAFAYNVFGPPMIETNIRTAIIHLFLQHTIDIDEEHISHIVEKMMKHTLVQEKGARYFYYALMDFGAQLKQNNISYNSKMKTYKKQSPYKDSKRALRALILFSITKDLPLPKDIRVKEVVEELIKEGFITRSSLGFQIVTQGL